MRGWRMGKLVAFVSIIVPTELVGLFPVLPPVYPTQNKCDPGLGEDIGATHLSASVIKSTLSDCPCLVPWPWVWYKHRGSRHAFLCLADR